MFFEGHEMDEGTIFLPTQAGYMVAFLLSNPRRQSTLFDMLEGAEEKDREEIRESMFGTLSSLIDEGAVDYKGEGVFKLSNEYWGGIEGETKLRFISAVCGMVIQAARKK